MQEERKHLPVKSVVAPTKRPHSGRKVGGVLYATPMLTWLEALHRCLTENYFKSKRHVLLVRSCTMCLFSCREGPVIMEHIHLPHPIHKEGIVTLAELSVVDVPCRPQETGVHFMHLS